MGSVSPFFVECLMLAASLTSSCRVTGTLPKLTTSSRPVVYTLRARVDNGRKFNFEQARHLSISRHVELVVQHFLDHRILTWSSGYLLCTVLLQQSCPHGNLPLLTTGAARLRANVPHYSRRQRRDFLPVGIGEGGRNRSS